ncbi:hypothetical protein GW819_00950 [Candidatus Gracilibacteria bacterium]|nr:hypothetical protein [Candidatus Gracilibacteria bacterium]PIQ12063.1 MAG: hypothetical protein COW68_00975 [Candidatus Gracilibacteria bacterium CG18_big_fil_WC_8_21_14_2_50_38_16]PIQ42246.1 MAG: hypothetical protein COW06_00210 [Candidatus Gracilibacteria bacterium CG12_big_fil_rev_8_21_14_0_65_38_15]PIZ01355.1 MAG: hypothetical protein COY60_03910 [Candidatus Gracilibacteria bacterium CG_4_10_14_0_8_um_filter_38_28]
MQSFQAVCAKNNQKVELVIKYNSLEEARQALHNQGYSIITIKQIEETENRGKVFYFDIILDGQKKNGQIQSTDIFKAYIKLVNDLHYQIISIYEDINATEEEKRFTTSKIHSGYLLYLEQNTKKEVKKEEKIEQTTQVQAAYTDISDTFVGKELQKYYILIDKIVQKIENILQIYGQDIESERKTKLQDFLITLKQLKNTTNIDKLRIIAESVLIKIGELELELLQTNKTKEKQNFLSETNDLLKKFGSGEKIVNPETDIYKKIQIIITEISNNFFTKKETLNEEKKIDTQSYVFYKNLRELNIYKEKLHRTQKDLFIAIILFQKEKITRLSIRKRLIIQNIQLIEKRIKNVKFSYTSIVKGFQYYLDVIIFLLKTIGNYMVYIIFIYSLFFIYFSLGQSFSFNYGIIKIIVIFSFFSFLTRFIKNKSSLIIYAGIFIFFHIVLQLNF